MRLGRVVVDGDTLTLAVCLCQWKSRAYIRSATAVAEWAEHYRHDCELTRGVKWAIRQDALAGMRAS